MGKCAISQKKEGTHHYPPVEIVDSLEYSIRRIYQQLGFGASGTICKPYLQFAPTKRKVGVNGQ